MIGVKTPRTERQLVVFFDKLNTLRKTEGLSGPHSWVEIFSYFVQTPSLCPEQWKIIGTAISSLQKQINICFPKGQRKIESFKIISMGTSMTTAMGNTMNEHELIYSQ